MKTIYLVFTGLLFSSVVFSQTITSAPDSTVEYRQEKYKVLTNKFAANWFGGAGIGMQFFYGDHNGLMDFGQRVVPAYELHIGKWFTPGVGMRIALNGLDNHGLTQNGSHSTGELYDEVNGLYVQDFQYINLHGDVLFNISNLIGGYKENRFYSMSPYVGLGWMTTWDEPVASEISANLGVFNSFRISDAIDLTLDVRGSMVQDRFDGELGGRSDEGMLTAAVGVVFRIGKTKGWNKNTRTIVRYNNDVELQALRIKVNELAADNKLLRRQLAEAKDTSVTDIVIEKNILAAPILITFPLNKSTVSNEARVNLGYFAQAVKDGDSHVVYQVVGYADKGTGSRITNERLSRERAQAIYNILVREFGVSTSQLNVEYKGGVENMFYDDPRLSRAVITIAK